MAKIVDHDQKRSDIVAVTARIIADEGMEAVTTRRIAKESGCSLGILSHYFANKNEIVLGALNWCDEHIEQRLGELYGETFLGLDDFYSLFLEIMPLSDQSDIEWRVRANLVTYSLTHPELKLARKQKIDDARSLANEFVDKLQSDGEIYPHINAQSLASMAVDVAFGMCINLLSFPLEERREHVDRMLAMLSIALKPGHQEKTA